MDRPSVPKYQHRVRENGFIIINTSLVDGSQLRTDIPCYGIQANKMAEEIGDQRVANMIVLGTFIKLSGLISAQTVMGALEEALPERHRHLLPLNERALAAGAEYIEQVIVPTR
jgi:2-oxoglutarate ferredoxin oxidoreductase subunit gamma